MSKALNIRELTEVPTLLRTKALSGYGSNAASVVQGVASATLIKKEDGGSATLMFKFGGPMTPYDSRRFYKILLESPQIFQAWVFKMPPESLRFRYWGVPTSLELHIGTCKKQPDLSLGRLQGVRGMKVYWGSSHKYNALVYTVFWTSLTGDVMPLQEPAF